MLIRFFLCDLFVEITIWKRTCPQIPSRSFRYWFGSMSDSESSDLIDSEAGLEENEDEQLLSSNSEDQPTEESEGDVETEENEEETSEDDEDDEEETSDEEEKKLTQDELKRLYLDDFSSDDEVSWQQRRVICRRQETPSVTYP